MNFLAGIGASTLAVLAATGESRSLPGHVAHVTAAARRPETPEDRLQPDAVLVGGEDLGHLIRMALGFLGRGFGKLF